MKLNTFLTWTVIGSLFAVLITPFIVSGSLFFPFIVGKNIFFRLMVEIGLGAWILLMLRDASFRPRTSLLLWSFAGFMMVIGIADGFGVNAWKSFWSNFERMEGYVTLLHLFAYFLMASTVLASEKIWKRFLGVSVAISTMICFFALGQLFDSGPQAVDRLDARLGNAIYLAVYALFNLFFIFILFARDTVMWKRIGYGALAFLHVVVLYNTGTRGAMLALLAGLTVFALLIALLDKKEKTKRIIAGSFIGILVLAVLGFIAVRNTSFVQESPVLSRFASLSLDNVQNQGRYFIWPMALKGFTERPIFGWGQENFNYVFNAEYDPRMYGHEQWFDRAHNVPLDWLVAGGILGLLAYLALFISAVFLLWRKSIDVSFTEKALLTGLFTAYFVNNLFVFDNITSYIMFVSLLAFIQFRSTRLTKPIGSEAGELGSNEMLAATLAVTATLALVVYSVNWKAYATGTTLHSALYYSSVQPIQPDQAAEAFKKALSYDAIGRMEVVERVVETASVMNTSEVSLELRQKFFEMGHESLSKVIERLPNDARYRLFAGSFYATYGQKELALEQYLKARELSPKKQTILFSLGSFYINNDQYEEAVDVFKEAYELEPSHMVAAGYYAASLIYADRDNDAKAFLLEKFGSDDMTADIFLQTYADKGNWTKVIELLRKRIAQEPTNIEEWQRLIGVYIQINNKAGAIAALREMVKVNPSLADEVEVYIKELSK